MSALALSLLVFWILGTDYHNFAVTLDNFAFVANGLYGWFNFHFVLLDALENAVC